MFKRLRLWSFGSTPDYITQHFDRIASMFCGQIANAFVCFAQFANEWPPSLTIWLPARHPDVIKWRRNERNGVGQFIPSAHQLPHGFCVGQRRDLKRIKGFQTLRQITQLSHTPMVGFNVLGIAAVRIYRTDGRICRVNEIAGQRQHLPPIVALPTLLKRMLKKSYPERSDDGGSCSNALRQGEPVPSMESRHA
jgi:hypothetical protein